MQQKALGRFESLKKDPNGAIRRLSQVNGAEAVTPEEVLTILEIYNDLFFFGASNLRFEWACLETEAAMAHFDGLIEMHPTRISWPPQLYRRCIIDFRAKDRIMVVQHEVVHAYFHRYSCRGCPTNVVNVRSPAGHG